MAAIISEGFLLPNGGMKKSFLPSGNQRADEKPRAES
jgi:hypothetical protein